MRVTAKVKVQTRGRILDAARNLFLEKGFERTTTRDIAATARVAAGTLFNYFPTKEALGLAIVAASLDKAREEFRGRLRGDEALDERLFAHIAGGLRHLGPHRGYIAPVVESGLGPFASTEGIGERIRASHLETVLELIGTNGSDGTRLPVVALHLYWTLFLGVLSYWAADDSENQENTLALLDQSMKLFVNSLGAGPSEAGR